MTIRVAVFFGGRSPEHDVSIMTGLQALSALDQRMYEAFPVYVGLDGRWWTGKALESKETFIPSAAAFGRLREVNLHRRLHRSGGRLVSETRSNFLRKAVDVEFDVALLALHGVNGEDGRLQGCLELYDVPYTGMRLLQSSVLMDKAATKSALAGSEIPVVPFARLSRPPQSLMPSLKEVEGAIERLRFPLIVKPNHLGSSIGVAKVNTLDDLRSALPKIFSLDSHAIIENCVENLVEYNISVTASNGKNETSAIESPRSTEELLDFKQKYTTGAGVKKTGRRSDSEGMLSLTREINPVISLEFETLIRRWATKCFELIGGSGAPRIDFLSDRITGEIWLNEVNPCPGSFAYFLWEAARKPIIFSDLLDKLIQEAVEMHSVIALPADPTLAEARLFDRRG